MHNIYPMFRALRNTSVKRYSKVVHSSITLSSLFYVSVALAGYITFTNMSQGMFRLFAIFGTQLVIQTVRMCLNGANSGNGRL